MPIYYACQRCGACCQWPGQVKLTEQEVEQIAVFLGMKVTDFIETHTQLNAQRSGLALKDQEDGSCIFFKEHSCLIQPVKPQQCRDFPNLWRFPGFETSCHAIPEEMNEADYRRKILEVTGRDLG